MKSKLYFSILVCLLPAIVFGQFSERGKIGASYSFGGVSLLRQQDFSKNLSPTSSKTAGLVYLHLVKENLEFETGLTFSLFSFYEKTDAETKDKMGSITLVDIPFGARATFGKYFFINGGGLLDLTTTNSSPISSQKGIGLYGGLGVVADFDFGGSIFLNPYAKLHSLIPFESWKGQDRILETLGVKIGMTFKL